MNKLYSMFKDRFLNKTSLHDLTDGNINNSTKEDFDKNILLDKIIKEAVKKDISTILIEVNEEFVSIYFIKNKCKYYFSKYSLNIINDVNKINDHYIDINNYKVHVNVNRIQKSNGLIDTYIKLVSKNIDRPSIQLTDIGFNEKEKDEIEKQIFSIGCMFITGERHAGKTTTAYYLIRHIIDINPKLNILILDDDLNFYYEGCSQVKKIDIKDYNTLLQYPFDIVFIDDVKTVNDAKFVYQCSLLGIRVIATMRSSSPLSLFYLLLNLGLTNHNILCQNFIKCIIHQALIEYDSKEKMIAEIISYPYIQKLYVNTLNKDGTGINHQFSSENKNVLFNKVMELELDNKEWYN